MESAEAAPDGVGGDNTITVGGQAYELRSMTGPDLSALEGEIARATRALKYELAQLMEATRAQQRAPREAELRSLLKGKKRLIQAIQNEFGRRKLITPPLADFAFTAVYEVYGAQGLERITQRSKALQNAHMVAVKRRGRAGSRRWLDRKEVCLRKIAHETEDAAQAAIEGMEREGIDAIYLQSYPCPFCHKFHVGHKPGSGAKTMDLLLSLAETVND